MARPAVATKRFVCHRKSTNRLFCASGLIADFLERSRTFSRKAFRTAGQNIAVVKGACRFQQFGLKGNLPAVHASPLLVFVSRHHSLQTVNPTVKRTGRRKRRSAAYLRR
jgi:hypothetical protein